MGGNKKLICGLTDKVGLYFLEVGKRGNVSELDFSALIYDDRNGKINRNSKQGNARG